jgi:hypothetical protein
MHFVFDLVSTKSRVRERGQGTCTVPAHEGKDQFEGGCAEIDEELYSIVGDSVCAIGAPKVAAPASSGVLVCSSGSELWVGEL